MNEIFFGVDKVAKTILYAGLKPHSYGERAVGLDKCNYATAADLSWAGMPNIGFLNETDTLAAGISDVAIAQAKADANAMQWGSLDQTRADLIQAQRWRIDRNNDEVAQGLTPTEDVKPVLTYMQLLRDLPTSGQDPFNIVWPEVPPLPSK